MQRLCVLGATGSIGRSTLEVVAANDEQFRVQVLTAYRDVEGMKNLIHRFSPERVVMVERSAAAELRRCVGGHCEVLDGADALVEQAATTDVDTVMAAIVGAAGLPATFAAARAGKRLLLATKEALVSAGHLLMDEVRHSGAEILPVDSEHNAIFQCLPQSYTCGARPKGVRRLILTASGGPFREWNIEQMRAATPAQAVAHPNWEMGRKISVDSATMMNKGLELIEAAYLYAMPADQIEVVVHRQSVVHSLVEFSDGSFLAQLGSADMKIPIAHAMLHPRRGDSGAQSLDLVALGRLDFEAPDEKRFPSLRLARESLANKDAMPAVFNAANEVAVEAFLAEQIAFTDIPLMVEAVMDRAQAWDLKPCGLESAIHIDAQAREQARAWEAARV